jgi:tripartite-type tricarboxylate transporter receptor subunit TctC
LHTEIKKALASPHVQASLLSDGAEAVGSDPDTFQKFFASEVNKWKTVVRNAGISPE